MGELKPITFIGHHLDDGLLRRVVMRHMRDGYIWVSHVTHGWNAAGQSITQGWCQPLPAEENRIELREGFMFVREDAVEPGGPEGGLRLKPRLP